MSDIIIIHPGSMYLRIGRSNDLNPEMILNCVGEKMKNSTYYKKVLMASI